VGSNSNSTSIPILWNSEIFCDIGSSKNIKQFLRLFFFVQRDKIQGQSDIYVALEV
jgi:hypothetical protein